MLSESEGLRLQRQRPTATYSWIRGVFMMYHVHHFCMHRGLYSDCTEQLLSSRDVKTIIIFIAKCQLSGGVISSWVESFHR